jgi:hypothetical protein
MDTQTCFLDDNFPLDLTLPFTRAQANAAGISDGRLVALCRSGLLRRPIRGVYVAAQVPDSLALRAAMLRLVVPPDCFVTDRTAGWLHGCPMILAPNDHLVVPRVSMFRPPDAGRLRNKLSRSGERHVLAEDLAEVEGLLVTTPLRTALDLGRLEKPAQALGCTDQLLRLGVFTTDELVANVERFRGERGVVQLRYLAPRGDARAQSPGESALRWCWDENGMPKPELQIPIEVNGHAIAFLDMGLPELLYGTEYDGVEWHTEPADREHDEMRRSAIRRDFGYVIEVFDRTHVYGPAATASGRLMRTFLEARRTLAQRQRRWA